MDLNNLANYLSVTNCDQVSLLSNQNNLNLAKKQSGYIIALLTISCDTSNSFSEEIKWNAAIQLKNFVIESWKTQVIPEDDKVYLRKNIINAMLHFISIKQLKLLKMLNQCLKKILSCDFDSGVYSVAFLSEIKSLFSTNNDNSIYIGIISYYQLSKLYEMDTDEKHWEKFKLTFDMFNSVFLTFLDNCTDIKNTFQNMIIYKLFRIFMKQIHYSIPDSLKNNINNYSQWMKHFEKIINIKVTDYNPINKGDEVWFRKIKQYAYAIVLRFYQKSQSKFKFVESDNSFYAYITKNEISKYLLLFTNDYYCNNNIYDECLSSFYKLLNDCYCRKQFNKDIFCLFLTKGFQDKWWVDIFITDKDIDYWYNSPKSYIVNQMTLYNIFKSKRGLAFDLLSSILTQSNKEFFIEYCDNWIRVLSNNEDAIRKTPEIDKITEQQFSSVDVETQKIIKTKEAILFIFEQWEEKICKQYPNIIGVWLNTFILNGLESKIGFIRERSISFIKQYSGFIIQDNNSALLKIVTKWCFWFGHDNYIVIRSISAITLPYLMRNQECKELIAKDIQPMMLLYWKWIDEIDLDELIDSIDIIVELLNKEIRNIIVPICEYFSGYLNKAIKKESQIQSDDCKSIEDGEEAVSIVDSVLKMFLKIIKYFVNDEDVYSKIENIIMSIIKYCCSCEGNGHWEEGLSIVISWLENKETITPTLWSVYKLILQSKFYTCESEIDYIEDIVTSACYYIAKDTNTFLDRNNNDYWKTTCLFFNEINKRYKENAEKVRYCNQIFITMLECCQGKIDDINEFILKYILSNYITCKKYMSIACGEMLSCSIIYNTNTAIDFLQTHPEIIDKYVNTLPYLKERQEIKRFLFAMCSWLTHSKFNENPKLETSFKVFIVYCFKFSHKWTILDNEREHQTEDMNSWCDDEMDDWVDVMWTNNPTIEELEQYNKTENKQNKDWMAKPQTIVDSLLNNNGNSLPDDEQEESDDDFFYSELVCWDKFSPFYNTKVKDILEKTLIHLSQSNKELNKILLSDKALNELSWKLFNKDTWE